MIITLIYTKAFIIKDIKNPRTPSNKIPIADTFAVISNSFLVGFLNTNQTLLHLSANDFVGFNKFTISYREMRSF